MKRLILIFSYFLRMASRSLSQQYEDEEGIPHDITFLCVDEAETNSWKEVKAHKLVLSLKSDVFKSQFYGAFCKKDSIIIVKDSHHQVFEVLIKYLYEIEDAISDLHSLQDLCSLYYLADKYDLTTLKVYLQFDAYLLYSADVHVV